METPVAVGEATVIVSDPKLRSVVTGPPDRVRRAVFGREDLPVSGRSGVALLGMTGLDPSAQM